MRFCKNVGIGEYILRAIPLFCENVGIDECFFALYAFILPKCRYRTCFSVNYDDILLFCGFWWILLWFLMIDRVFDVGSEESDVRECNGD